MLSTAQRIERKPWISTGEAARKLGVSIDTVKRLIETGRLVARRPGMRYQVSAASVHERAQPIVVVRRPSK